MQKPRSLGPLTALIAMVAIFAACNFKMSKAPTADDPNVAGKPIVIPSFAQMKSAFLDAKCFVCHTAGFAKGDYHTYELFHEDMANIACHVRGDCEPSMPPTNRPQLSADEKSTLLAWIAAGGPENGALTAAPTPSPTPVAVAVPSFANLSAAILAPKCFVCHDGASDPDAIDLREYTAFAKHTASARRRVLLPLNTDGHMPEADHPQLTSEELSVLVAWIDAGSPEAGTGLTLPAPGPAPAATPAPTPAPSPTPEPVATPSPSASPTPAPSVSLPSFQQLKASVVGAKCLSCHDGISDPDADDLSDYASFKKHLKGIRSRILLPIDDKKHMPKKDHAQLTSSELQLILAWIDGGAPENGSGSGTSTPATPVQTAR